MGLDEYAVDLLEVDDTDSGLDLIPWGALLKSPSHRRRWKSEHHNMPMFKAVALGMSQIS